MLRSVAFEGVVLQVPSNVEVGVESGELTLSFSNFSGDVSVRPKKRKSPDEQETEQGGKRIALSQAAGSDFVFPNGGRSPFKNGGQGGSQASSSAGDAPEPRALAWDELRDTTSPNGGQPEPGAGSGFSPNGGQPEPGGSGSAPAAASDEPCGSQHPAAAAAAAAASAAAFDAAKTDDEDDDDDDAPAGGGVGERLGEATQVGHEATQVGANTLANAVSAATSGPSSPAAERSAAAAAEAAPFAFAEGEWATAAWEWTKVKPKGEAPPPRWAHSAVGLGGTMLVFGGDALDDDGDGALADLYRYDGAGRKWKKCADAPQPRSWHTAALVGGVTNAKAMLVCGGDAPKEKGGRQALSTMVSYDPEYDVWYEAVDRGHRPTARAGHSAVLHHAHGAGQKLVVFGGVGSSGRRFAEPELHELHIGADWSWRRALTAGKPPFPRAYHTCTALGGGRLLLFGGNDVEKSFKKLHVLDLATMSWEHPDASGDVAGPAARTGHAAVCLDGVHVLVHGGWDYAADGEGYDFRDDAYVLDTRTWAWTKLKPKGAPPPPRVGHSLVALDAAAAGGSAPALVLFGGRGADENALGDLYVLAPKAA